MALVVLALLLAALIVTAVRIRSERAFARAAVPGDAVITDLRLKRVGPLPDRDTVAYPLLRLTLPDGTTVENWAERATTPAAGAVGDRVDVLYLREQPSRIRINGG
jgi:hypothetical protein